MRPRRCRMSSARSTTRRSQFDLQAALDVGARQPARPAAAREARRGQRAGHHDGPFRLSARRSAVSAATSCARGASDPFGDSKRRPRSSASSRTGTIFDGRATARPRGAGPLDRRAKPAEPHRERRLAAEVEVRRAFSSWQEATELVEASRRSSNRRRRRCASPMRATAPAPARSSTCCRRRSI